MPLINRDCMGTYSHKFHIDRDQNTWRNILNLWSQGSHNRDQSLLFILNHFWVTYYNFLENIIDIYIIEITINSHNNSSY